MTALTIDSLTVRIPLRGSDVVHAATEVSLDVRAGTVTALVGESGCGKSIVASAVLGVLPAGSIVTGSVHLALGDRTLDVLGNGARGRDGTLDVLGNGARDRDGTLDVLGDGSRDRDGSIGVLGDGSRGHRGTIAAPTGARMSRRGRALFGRSTGTARGARRRGGEVDHPYRGRNIALVPQSPSTHFTPVRTIGSQLGEAIRALGTAHTPEDLAARAGLESSALALYPHELSGGMAQRAAVAAALAGNPEVIVADEPTSGLDRDRTDQIGQLLRDCADRGAAVLLITHDLGHLLRAGIADTVAIMYASRLMEVGPAAQVLADPWHAYTGDLLAALPERGLHPLPHPPRALTNLSDVCPYAGTPTALLREDQRMIRRPRS